jgi:hypothetical protein
MEEIKKENNSNIPEECACDKQSENISEINRNKIKESQYSFIKNEIDKKKKKHGLQSIDNDNYSKNSITYKIVIPIFVFGVILLSIGIICEEYDLGIDKNVSLIIKEIGVVLMVVAVIHSVYELRIHKYLHGDIIKLRFNVEELQKTVSIVGGAIESGLSAVYSSREEVNNAIEEEIRKMKPGSTLKLLGISLGAFLCPHGALHGAFRMLLAKKDIEVIALLLNADSDSALERAKMEEPRFFINKTGTDEIKNAYQKTRCHNELKTATDFAQDIADHCWYRDKNKGQILEDAPNEPPIFANFFYKVYNVSPLCYLVIFENCMFLENYHNAGRGGESPVLKIGKQSGESMETTSLFRIYENHFNVMKNSSNSK